MKTMSEKAEILVQCIENEIMENGGKTIDFHKHSVRCALDIICGKNNSLFSTHSKREIFLQIKK